MRSQNAVQLTTLALIEVPSVRDFVQIFSYNGNRQSIPIDRPVIQATDSLEGV